MNKRSAVMIPLILGVAVAPLELAAGQILSMKMALAACLLIPVVLSAGLLCLYRRYEPCGWFTLAVCGAFVLIFLVILTLSGSGLDDDSFYILALNWAGAAGPCFVVRLADRKDRLGGFRGFFMPASLIFGILYLLTLAWALFFKMGPYVGAIRSVNFIPLRTILPYLTGAVAANRGTMIINLLANLLLFVPYGFYMNIVAGKLPAPVRAGLLAALPAALEILQWATGRGVMDIDDFILNVLGAVMGVGLYFLLEWAFGRIRRDARRKMLTL